MIIEGIITKIEREDSKTSYIEVRLCRVQAICFDGPDLIDDTQEYYVDLELKNGPNELFIEKNKGLYLNLYSLNIIGYIRKNDVI
jgi:hypothetical protein